MEAWEALDVDDSDLPSLLRPCNKRHRIHSPTKSNQTTPSHSQQIPTPSSQVSQSHSSQTLPSLCQPIPAPAVRLIPGPAGTIQAAMLRKRILDYSEEPPIPTQEYIRRAVENAEDYYQDDDDFKGNPWLRAIEFLNTSQSTVDFVLPSTPLSSVEECLENGKVDLVVAVIKSCTPNGLGDMMVTLKDPTGIIGGSIHRKVLTGTEFAKDISVRSVLILEKVSIFAPSRTTLYLNITQSNVVKVFCKDIGPPLLQTHLAPKVTYAPPTECREKMRMLQKAFSLRTKGIMNEISPIANARSWHINKRKEKGNPFSGSDNCSKGSITSQNAAIRKEPLWPRQGAANKEVFEEAVRSDIADDNNAALDSNDKCPPGDNLSDSLQHGSVAANLVENRSEEVQRIDKLQKKRVQPSKASLPQWTDEQLKELFVGACDDVDSLF